MQVFDMVVVGEIVVVGVFACLVFDLWQRIFQKMTAIPPSNWEVAGRWCIGLFTRGRLIARGLDDAPAMPRELPVGWLLHYGVAVGYAAVYAGLMAAGWLQAGFADGLLFGVASVAVPWFFFLPCLGKGVLARLTPNPLLVCALGLMMHTLFGVAIGVGFAVMRWL